MGGINCGTAPYKMKRCKITDELAEYFRLDYALIVKSVFKVNAEFSLANVGVEEIMLLEKKHNYENAENQYYEVKNHLLACVNVANNLTARINEFLSNMNKSFEQTNMNDEDVLVLKKLNGYSSRLEIMLDDLYNAYLSIPFSSLVKEGKINQFIREGSITQLTENSVLIISQELSLLREYSLLASKNLVLS